MTFLILLINLQDLGEGEDSDEEEGNYLQRLDGGLFTLQLVDFIILEACTGGAPSVKQRVTQILNLRGKSVKTIRHVMRGTSLLIFVWKIFGESN